MVTSVRLPCIVAPIHTCYCLVLQHQFCPTVHLQWTPRPPVPAWMVVPSLEMPVSALLGMEDSTVRWKTLVGVSNDFRLSVWDSRLYMRVRNRSTCSSSYTVTFMCLFCGRYYVSEINNSCIMWLLQCVLIIALKVNTSIQPLPKLGWALIDITNIPQVVYPFLFLKYV